MFALLAVIFFLAAVVVHGAAFTAHSHWFGWQGLILLALLCWFLSGFGPQFAWLRKKQQ